MIKRILIFVVGISFISGLFIVPTVWSAMESVPPKIISAGDFHSLALRSDGTLWAWGYNGFGLLGEGTYTDRNSPVPIFKKGDFDGDWRTDILWSNISTGQNYVWYQNGIINIGGGYIDTVADLHWKIVGVGDFNYDGKPDILWRNSVTGQNYVWYMNGATNIGGDYVETETDLNWKIVGVADFNNDGKPDILWRNSVTGQNYVWYMNGATNIGGDYVETVTDLNWKIVGLADVNGDGKTDILWRNSANGQNYVWYMNGATNIGGDYVDTVSNLDWEIRSVGIFTTPEASATISPSGGTYYLPNGIILEVPQGAVSAMTTVHLRRVGEEEVMPILQSYGLTEKYFMAAYDAEPKGLKFNKPINIFLPSKPLENSTTLPFLFDVNHVNQIYSPAMLGSQPVTGALRNLGDGVKTNEVVETKYFTYDCKTNQIKMRNLTEFPGDEWVQAMAMINKILSNSDCIANPCRCCTIEVVAKDSDSEVLNGCVNTTTTGSVTFKECPGQPVESWNMTESNIGKLDIMKTPDKDTIGCNEQIVLSVGVKDARGNSIPDYIVNVTTQNGDIVQITYISKNVYYIKGIGSGVATIKVDPGCDRAENITITVKPVVDSVTVTPSTASISVGRTLQLTATPKDINGNVLTGLPVSWSSSNTAVATVDSSGLITGVSAGTSTVTATVGCTSGSAIITVSKSPPSTTDTWHVSCGVGCVFLEDGCSSSICDVFPSPCWTTAETNLLFPAGTNQETVFHHVCNVDIEDMFSFLIPCTNNPPCPRYPYAYYGGGALMWGNTIFMRFIFISSYSSERAHLYKHFDMTCSLHRED